MRKEEEKETLKSNISNLIDRVKSDLEQEAALDAELTPADRIAASLNTAVCNFFAVAEMAEILCNHGFTELQLEEEWSLRHGGKYFVRRNDTSIFAFVCGKKHTSEAGFHIIAAHSDSPGFKLKPNPEIYGDGGVVSLNVEKYGGPIMYTWFDRPLSIAARVMLRGEDPLHPVTKLVDLVAAVAVIPHLAIHFNRAVNEGNPLSVQKDMKPVMGYMPKEKFEEMKSRGGVVKCAIAREAGVEPEEILAMEAVLYPVDAVYPGVGLNEEYIVSPRLDDLSMAYAALDALTATCDDSTSATRVMAIFDNEETGSGTRQGAAAPTLRNILERVTIALRRHEHESMMADERSLDMVPAAQQTFVSDPEDFYRSLERTFLISADDAHAWHPNYNDKYDPTNHPVIGGGPVVKINANCKYMTDSRGDAIFRALCDEAGVKCQYFVNHADVAGGSTLGNILTSQLDIAGVDMGCAIWAMHSTAETGGVSDLNDTVKVFSLFYRS